MLRSHDQTPWTLVDFRKQLQHEVETREKSSLGQSDKEVSGLHFQFQGLYSWCLVHWCAGKRERKNGCMSCDGPHPSDSCKIVRQQLTRDSPQPEILRNQKRCFRCFKKDYVSKSCYSKKRYLRCNGKHHLALCKSIGVDGHKSSATDPADENTSNASRDNPEKDDSTIAEGSTLVGSTLTSTVSTC